MYRLGKHPNDDKRRRRLTWLIIFICLILTAIIIVVIINHLKPKTVIKQSKPTTARVDYNTETKRYEEADFTIDLPVGWSPVPRYPGPYQTFTWQTSEHGTNGQTVQIFEDTIPANFAVNRALIVESQIDHLSQKGEASDNCSKYTRGLSTTPNQVGARAKWQGIEFLCDQANQQRDVIGTSSTDGINTVILRSPSTGRNHSFLFTYTTHDITPDYAVFYNALASFRMK